MISTALRDELKLITKTYSNDLKDVRSEALHNLLSLADKISAQGGYVTVCLHPEFLTLSLSRNIEQATIEIRNKAGSLYLESAADLIDAIEAMEKILEDGTEDDIKFLFEKEESLC